jgi:hypothetical protein
MRHIKKGVAAVAVSLALTLLAGCGSLGGILGGQDPNYPNGGSTYPNSSQTSEVQGTINSVDTQSQRIEMTVSYVDGRRSNTNNAVVYYDSRTRVLYQNGTYRPNNLERGDQVDVRLYNSGNGQSVADTIEVVRRASASNYPNNNYPNNDPNNYPNNYPSNTQTGDIRGSVNYIDTQAQRIDLNVSYISGLRDNRGNSSVYYDNRTRVVYQNQTYLPTDLERGDQVDVRVSNNGNGQYLADTITVTRNIRSNY